MASLAWPGSCPSSSQLRLGVRSRKCVQSPLLLRMTCYRAAASSSRLRIRAFSAAAARGRGDEEEGRKLRSKSWGNSGKSEAAAGDSFSGWDGNGSAESKQMGKFGGVVGAALAGLFLTAAAVFGSFSLKQKTSGLKQQMQPMTIEQEELLASDESNENVDHTGTDGNMVLVDGGNTQNGFNPENGAGIEPESPAASEVNGEAISESSSRDITSNTSLLHTIKPETNLNEPFSFSPCQEDMQYNPQVDDSVPAGHNSQSPDLPESDMLNFSKPDAITYTDGFESDVKLKENLSSDEAFNAPDADSLNLCRTIEGASNLETTENTKNPSEFSSDSAGALLRESLSSSAPETPESDVAPDSKVESRVALGTVTSVSRTEVSFVPEAPQFPDEGISMSPEKSNVDEAGFSQGAAAPLLNAYHDDNVPNMVGHHESDGSTMVFEPFIPEITFSSAGIPAPSLVSAVLQVSPGKVVVPATIEQVQVQALAALQVLKVIEADVQPGDLCTRREYARWLLSASSVLSRSTVSKVYPAMYIENVTELAFDDVTPEDPDFPSIQGLAEAGLIWSKLSRFDTSGTSGGNQGPILFSPESPLSRQDLVSWKMALEKKELPEADRKSLYQRSGFLDIEKIHPDAWPALMADLSAGEHGILTLAFGYTRLFQPDKPVTKAQAAVALATGDASDIVGEELARMEAESMAETAVAAHNALVAEVERDINMEFEKELALEREKIATMEKLAEETRLELESLKAEREREKVALVDGRVAVDSEKEILSRLRHDAEVQLENLMSKKTEIMFERERIDKLKKEAESESQAIAQLQYELEVERKALSMARAWAEEEAQKARQQAKNLEEARNRWERQGLKVIVAEDLREDVAAGVTWVNEGEQVTNRSTTDSRKTINGAESLVEKLKMMAGEMKLKSSIVIERLIQKIELIITSLRQKSAQAAASSRELQNVIFSKASVLADGFQKNTSHFGSSIKDGVKRVAGDCREGLEKFTQQFKA